MSPSIWTRCAATAEPGALSLRAWRVVEGQHVVSTRKLVDSDAEQQLLPLLKAGEKPDRERLPGWCDSLVAKSRELLDAVLPLVQDEVEFLTRLNDHGEVVPDLLTDEAAMQQIVAEHPMLAWKAQNVREHRAGTSKTKRDREGR